MRAKIKQVASAVVCNALVAGTLVAPVVAAPQASATTPAATPQMDWGTYSELGVLEDRFFSRQYVNDPIEKRLERIELLVFGGSQDGNNLDRLGRLRKIVAERAKKGVETAKKDVASPDSAAPKAGSDTKTASGAGSGGKDENYPILGTLEWRALKKSYQAENIDQRLNRLETKLFGQASPGMPYYDRIERVKRTLGIGVTTTLPPQGGFSPMPKARPRNQQDIDNFGWGYGQPLMPEGGQVMPQDPYGGMGMDPNANMDMASTLSRMMQEMNRQMGALHGMQGFPGMQQPGGNGFGFSFGMPGQGMQTMPNMPGMKGFSKSWSFKMDPKTGQWTEEHSETPIGGPEDSPGGAKIGPAPKTKLKAAPVPMFVPPDDGLPPYADPNSI